ncbi:alcohol dehydrogenase [Carbonactinospora thermoautotrophica]|uniref:Alcohol dehydrogenase n=1 Tax=Carbonactinospora thermoautotrophica TaxID=1469144 RepID=A0A132MTC8_9ACTN|nr:iron-containing alcohol dehydrogenase [Carbonactinospora thermoautotrophica]KWX01158.1 Alcohol dehydrogenase [Carbonactinospora thermoautotrophica]KWX05425.1 alcohol dehydrogenase [Carbonactinospora thermoautotrophica]KWX05516.1 alcohol dehydrogenase [Carbonactinospora thermoautotrophica]
MAVLTSERERSRVRQSASNVSKFLVPEIVFGPGSLSEAGYAARRLGARRVFVVTDPGIIEAGWVSELLRYLSDAGLPFTVWHGVTPNPKDHEIAAGYEVYRDSASDVIIGIGGGSVMDAAKAIAVLSTNGGQILDYEGVDKVTRAIPPLLMIPSTSGTGADVSQFCVITDTARKIKATLIGRALVPDISITDPRLLVTMPEWLAATTGLDALTHGIEAYVSRAASALTDVHALTAVRLVSDHLVRTIDRPRDENARIGMAQASLGAGLAFTNAILGATHAMSHQVGGALDLPHGVINGILLPHVIRFNAAANAERYVPIARALGVDVTRLSPEESAYAVADAVRRLADEVGVPRGLADLGVTVDDIPTLAANTLRDVCLSTNPRDASVEEVAALFRAAL